MASRNGRLPPPSRHPPAKAFAADPRISTGAIGEGRTESTAFQGLSIESVQYSSVSHMPRPASSSTPLRKTGAQNNASYENEQQSNMLAETGTFSSVSIPRSQQDISAAPRQNMAAALGRIGSSHSQPQDEAEPSGPWKAQNDRQSENNFSNAASALPTFALTSQASVQAGSRPSSNHHEPQSIPENRKAATEPGDNLTASDMFQEGDTIVDYIPKQSLLNPHDRRPDTLIFAEAFSKGVSQVIKGLSGSNIDNKLRLVLGELASRVISDHERIDWHDQIPRTMPPPAPNKRNNLMAEALLRETQLKKDLSNRKSDFKKSSEKMASRKSEFLHEFTGMNVALPSATEPSLGDGLPDYGLSCSHAETLASEVVPALEKARNALSDVEGVVSKAFLSADKYMDSIKRARRDPSKDLIYFQRLCEISQDDL